jgi:hypothetical protein
MVRTALLAAATLLALASVAEAQNRVQGYMRNDGTYVQPHYRTNPDGNRFNNYSTQGNVNPYTGQTGTVNPYAQPSYGGYGVNNVSPYANPYARRRY